MDVGFSILIKTLYITEYGLWKSKEEEERADCFIMFQLSVIALFARYIFLNQNRKIIHYLPIAGLLITIVHQYM